MAHIFLTEPAASLGFVSRRVLFRGRNLCQQRQRQPAICHLRRHSNCIPAEFLPFRPTASFHPATIFRFMNRNLFSKRYTKYSPFTAARHTPGGATLKGVSNLIQWFHQIFITLPAKIFVFEFSKSFPIFPQKLQFMQWQRFEQA